MVDVDRKLVEQAQRDPVAFGQLYDLYANRIFQYAYRQTGDEAQAQDVTAVTFTKALHTIHTYQWRGQSVLAWLYRIARNEIISQQRKRKWLTPWQHSGQSDLRQTETAVWHNQRRQQIHHALSQIPAKDREIIHLRYFEELSSEEVAAILGCSTNNVYVKVHRALSKLHQKLATMGVTEEVFYEG